MIVMCKWAIPKLTGIDKGHKCIRPERCDVAYPITK